MSIETLILELTTDLKPVRPRRALRETLLLLALVGLEATLILALGAMRQDMGHMIGSSYMAWKIGSPAVVAVITCAITLRSFSPPASPRRGLKLVLGLSGATMIGGPFLASTTDTGRPLLDRLFPAQGILCAGSIIVLALPLMAMLGVAMRRAAPTHPESSALAAGLAAGACAALAFTLCGPMDDPLSIVIWYGAGCASIAILARWLLPRGFRL